MRLGVAGKGGAGKTTITATLARLFAARGFAVNALDGDPNPNLAAALGVDTAELPRLTRFPGELVAEETNAGHEAALHFTRPFEEIVDEYGVLAPGGVRTLAMTGLLGAGQGCICGQHRTVRGVIAELGALRPDDVTILDMEASLEHLSRGTVRNVETLLIVVEPYYRALETLGRTAPMARELGIASVLAVANKVRSQRDEETIAAYVRRNDVELVGVIPYDEAVLSADAENRAAVDAAPDAPAMRAIAALVTTLIERAGVTAPGTGSARTEVTA